MRPDDLATLLDEANHHPWESVRAALAAAEGLSDPHLEWLKAHLVETKRNYWALVATTTGTSAPPDSDLATLMTWEVEIARQLSPDMLAKAVEYGDFSWTVGSLLRFSARHTTWHAGQMAGLSHQLRASQATTER